ncbi:transposase [Sphingomonas sp. CFBP 8760]|uniref:transposase n=1 Tax=Sphingomonas sp. CFBP 8760 TaxID=2775282 RepID=UPI00177C7BF1|nr:transposase [Sphingomonas sp. CFBP 8760]MBD8548852.1 transposase [Sphingomonas sp. CFBP 8760]
MEVVGRVSGQRRWSDAEKIEILTEAFRPGVRGYYGIAHREVSSSLIYTWHKQLREGQLASVGPSLPVFAAEPVTPTSQCAPCCSGFIQIELPDVVRVSVDAHADAAALTRVLSVLR